VQSPPRRALLLAAGAAGLAGAGVAVAAALGVSSARLTVQTYASSIPATSCTLNAANADSYVQQQTPSSNFGTATTMHVRSASGSGNRRSFVQLVLGPCSIPGNALIVTANLKLFMHAAPAVSRTYAAHRVNGTWTESGITWTNQPAVAASATASVATGTTSNVTLTWNVTSDVQAFVDGTSNYGWRIADTVENSATARIGQFRTAEHGTASQRPILEITYYP
jgi:hypothetical protein